MATHCETTRAQISQWETGAQRVPFSAAIRLRIDYGVTLDFMYMGDMSSMRLDLAQRIQENLHPEK